MIAWGTCGRRTPEAIFRAWMRSKLTAASSSAKRWRDVGIGRAAGTFRGASGVRMYTVDFGRRV